MKKYLFLSVLCALMSFCIAAPVLALPTPIGPAVEAVYNQQDWPVFIGYSAGLNMGFSLTDYSGGDEGKFVSPLYTGTTPGTPLYDLVSARSFFGYAPWLTCLLEGTKMSLMRLLRR